MYNHVDITLAKFEVDINLVSKSLENDFSLPCIAKAMREASFTESWLIKRFCDNQTQLELRGENYEIDDVYEGYFNRSSWFSNLKKWNELWDVYLKRCDEELEKEKEK